MPTEKTALESNRIIRSDLDAIAAAPLPWKDLHRSTVMVTGGGGFLSAYLIKSLLHAADLHGLQIHTVCVGRGGASIAARLADQLNSKRVQVVLQDIGQPLPIVFPAADYIVHAASQASPKFYGTDPVGTLTANSVGTAQLLQHARSHAARRFLFFSSGEVYGIPLRPDEPVKETDMGYLDPMQVRSCYAESKRMGETMCVAWAKQFGLHTGIVRPFHTYGPGMALDDGRVFSDFVADVVHGRDITLKSDGAAMRPFCYIADATIAFLKVLLTGESAQAYNVGNPEAEISIRDLAQLMAGLFPEKKLAVNFPSPSTDGGYLRSPTMRSYPSVEKIANLGWAPTTDLHTGFRRTVQSFL